MKNAAEQVKKPAVEIAAKKQALAVNAAVEKKQAMAKPPSLKRKEEGDNLSLSLRACKAGVAI